MIPDLGPIPPENPLRAARRLRLNVTPQEFAFIRDTMRGSCPLAVRSVVLGLGLPRWLVDDGVHRTVEVVVRYDVPALPWRGYRERTVERLVVKEHR